MPETNDIKSNQSETNQSETNQSNSNQVDSTVVCDNNTGVCWIPDEEDNNCEQNCDQECKEDCNSNKPQMKGPQDVPPFMQMLNSLMKNRHDEEEEDEEEDDDDEEDEGDYRWKTLQTLVENQRELLRIAMKLLEEE